MQNLDRFKEYIQGLQGEWNGDESGTMEDQANICAEILEHVTQIEVLIKELTT